MRAIISSTTTAIALSSILLASLSVAQAQGTVASAPASAVAIAPASTPDEGQSVEVKAVRDPAIMPYKTAYELITKVRAATKDHVQFLIRVTSIKTKAPVPDLDIYLDGASIHEKVEVSPTGFVTVPLNEAAFAEGAEFVSNKKKGSLQVEFFLQPNLPTEVFKYADIVESVAAAQSAMKEILPWYLRVFLPTVHGIGICYPNQDQSVLVKGGEEKNLVANSNETDMMRNKVYCARFPVKEAAKAQGNLVMPSSGWQAIFL